MAILKDPAATVRDTALSIHNNGKAAGIRAANWHYMNYGDQGEELYDMVQDPHQYTNVAFDPAYAETRAAARALLEKRMAAAR
jgi:arylsulfatase A-like enzyme